MKITPCPACGRMPIIIELPVNKNYKNGIRRRFCGCPGHCDVIPEGETIHDLNRDGFVFDGNGDANNIYKMWNAYIEKFYFRHPHGIFAQED